MILNQIDGFFPRLDQILPEIKKIPLYTNDEYLKTYKLKSPLSPPSP